jgi:predicted cupin superfamily sugar epimerase
MSGVLPDWAIGLGLQPHPEGGWFAETWRSGTTVELAGYPAPRALGTAIYFLLLPGEESAWHHVRSAELWFHHRGPAVELSLGGSGDEPSAVSAHRLGPDVAGGEAPQLLVPPDHWQAARLLGDEAVLVSCVVVPGFDFADFTLLRPA